MSPKKKGKTNYTHCTLLQGWELSGAQTIASHTAQLTHSSSSLSSLESCACKGCRRAPLHRVTLTPSTPHPHAWGPDPPESPLSLALACRVRAHIRARMHTYIHADSARPMTLEQLKCLMIDTILYIGPGLLPPDCGFYLTSICCT